MADIRVSDLSILLVEPSTFQQKMIVKELEEAGCTQVDTVSSIAESLDFIGRYTPDLVISNMYLPDGQGYELVAKMRESDNLQSVPYMLISSEQRPAQIEPIKQAGSVAILPKPFQRSDLINALEATLAFVEPEEMELDNYSVDELRVLVVDDSAFSLKHIGRALESLGIEQIDLANSGAEAVAMIDSNEYHLIFTDYNMPEMDGEELTRYVRDQSNQPYVPILMVTSEQNETRLNGVKRAGVNAICDKPFTPQNLKALIINLLDIEADA